MAFLTAEQVSGEMRDYLYHDELNLSSEVRFEFPPFYPCRFLAGPFFQERQTTIDHSQK